MPSGFTTTVPLVGSVVLVHTLPPSALGVSLPSRLPLTGTSFGVVVLSSTATGTAVAATVMVTVAVLLSPSLSVMV